MAVSKDMSNSKINPDKKLKPVWICIALAVFTFIAFFPVKESGFISLDDNMYVTENVHVQSGLNWNSVQQAFSLELAKLSSNWHPLTWFSWMLDYSLFGLDPSGYHLVNLLLHILNTILLFLILRRMTGTLWPGAFVAALFAIHPLHVESVAWIAERKDVLSTFFMMLTLGAYSYYVEQRNFKRYAFVLLFFILGLMAKPMLVTLPFVLLLLDYWPLRRLSEVKPVQKIQAEVSRPIAPDGQKKSKKKDTVKGAVKQTPIVTRPAGPLFQWSLAYPLLLEKVPLFILAVLSSIITYLAQQRGGAVSSSETMPLLVRIGNALISYIAYIGKMFLPVNLAVFYPHPGNVVFWQVSGALVLLIVFTATAFRMARKFPYLTTGWFWYLGTLVPVIGIVQVGSQSMADRYTYIPLIGLFIIAAWGIPDLLKKVHYRKEILAAASILCIFSFSIVTWIQAGYWKDSLTLFDHTLKVTDGNWLIHYNRGKLHNILGNYNQAIEDNSRAIEIRPRDAVAAYNNRGNAYSALGNHRKAIEDYGKAIANKPDYVEAYYNRGIAYNVLSDYARAIEDFSRAIRIKGDHADAYNNRGATYYILGNQRQAIEDYGRAIEIKPDFAGAYFNRGVAYAGLGNREPAVQNLKMAARLGDERARNFLKRNGMNW